MAAISVALRGPSPMAPSRDSTKRDRLRSSIRPSPGVLLANSHRIGKSARRDGRDRRTKRLTGSTIACRRFRSGAVWIRQALEYASDVFEQEQRLGGPAARLAKSAAVRIGREPERNASSSGAAGDMRPISSALLTPQVNCIAAACSTIAAKTADLPIPGSPSSTSTAPRPGARTCRSMLSAEAIGLGASPQHSPRHPYCSPRPCHRRHHRCAITDLIAPCNVPAVLACAQRTVV